MTTFHLRNFGCRASQADGTALKRQLLEAGLEEVPSAERSDVAVLNTCTVTATADAEVRQVIRSIHRKNPRCRILVTGCYAQRAPHQIAELQGVAWVVGNSHKHAVADLLKKCLEFGVRGPESFARGDTGLVQIQECYPPAPAVSKPATDHPVTPDSGLLTRDLPEVLVGEISDDFHFAPVFPDDRTRPTLKIQDGCDARCSFCIIPSVRGRSRSLAAEKVIEQIRDLVEDGYREVVLSGINLGSYGRDLDRRISFLGLLEEILAQTSVARIRISSIEPMDVSPQLIRLVAQEWRLAQHFHVPLQSGCDRILRQMNRRYWTAQYAERILAIRDQIPHGGIGADVMIGFPGETDLDHLTSMRFIESLPFTYLHIFPYSQRPSTPAAARSDQVDRHLIRQRTREMRSLIARKREAFLAAQVGRKISAVTLDETDTGTRLALSSNYLKVVLPAADVPPNTILEVRVGRACADHLYGYVEP